MTSADRSDLDALQTLFGSSDWIDRLEVGGAGTLDAFRAVCAVAISDGGSLPRSTKLLFVSAIAAAKNDAEVSRRALQAAFDDGLGLEEAFGAASTLLVSRGAIVASIFCDAVHAVAGETPPSVVAPDPAPVDALEYFREAYDRLPERIELIVRHVPELLDGFHRLRSLGLGHPGLSPKHTELLLVALNSSLHEGAFVASHARDARLEGATEAELAEAVATALPLGGLAAWRPGADGIAQSRDTSVRP